LCKTYNRYDQCKKYRVSLEQILKNF